ncbi:paraneoplastic antigen Ma1 homolog [Sinocyclocheilus anshuiensis]|uniref:paraneoplastic antigen Ma1 homolog n=1 Tax=Sinocyclocheilus anshuiensis TaxID=1608454 RepID=UPI0007B99057|nr:PREDICTED: paraneoplastic antigen Ma1 homolog [Sinocyclocheilus anshuiensis]
MHAPSRLRVFSGKIPRPSTEVDYDAWRGSVELILQDPSLSDLHRSRKILDSLLPPASEIVRHLGATAPPNAYLDILDSAFDAVEDGDDLFARFLNTLQNAGEKPSLYLQRLQTALLKAMKRGAVSNAEADKQLLKQFCRGCWNDALITNLQLEGKQDSPPSFSELLLQLRSKENRHSAKESRKHLNVHRQKASSNVVSTSSFDWEQGAALEGSEIAELRQQVTKLQSQLSKQKAKKTEKPVPLQSDDVLELKKQIAELQSQFTKLGSQKPLKQEGDRETKQACSKPTASAVVQKSQDRPKPGYCFRCGEDGHNTSGCESDPNRPLVNEKQKQLRERQSLWDRQQCPVVSESLNWN